MSVLKDFYETNQNVAIEKERLQVLLYNAFTLLQEQCEYTNDSLCKALGTTEEELKHYYPEVFADFSELDCDYEGVELCCRCGKEFDFTYNPVKNHHIVCSHCGEKQHPCSLCDCSRMAYGCHQAILLELKDYNDSVEE